MAELLAKLTALTKVVIISGGSYAQFEKQFLPFLSRTGLVKNNLILLPTSGSQCYEYDRRSDRWKITAEECFPADVKEKVMAVVKEMVESGQYEIPSQRWGECIEDRGTQITLSALGQAAPIAEKQKWDPDQKKRRKIKAELDARLPEVDSGIGGTTSLDILPKGFNKAVGLKHLTERFGYQLEDLAFVADEVFPGGNNYSVFEAGVETIRVNNPKETALVIKDWLS